MILKYLSFITLCFCLTSRYSLAQEQDLPKPLKIGVSVNISSISPAMLYKMKSAGISSMQIGVNDWFDKNGHFKVNDEKILEEVRNIKKAADAAGITIAAIHMPYGKHIDLSLIDETAREGVVALHGKVLRFCRILKPAVILFHPSWFLSLNQREEHINKLIKSVLALKDSVDLMGATMVIENMTGPKLHVTSRGVEYERPLCRTVEETMNIMKRLPSDVYAAVDMNHISHPEQLISALGKRLKFIHVSDGDGEHEYHYFPCSGKGMNDWNAILNALYKAEYTGPFMYECHYKDFKDLEACYHFMYYKYILDNYIRPKYQ